MSNDAPSGPRRRAGDTFHDMERSSGVPDSDAATGPSTRMGKIQVGSLAVSLDDVGAGEPVVLIHGLACGKRMWFHQVRALRDRFRVIAYDQRGHGLTDAPAEANQYSPRHLVRDLAGLLDALGIARAAI